MSNVLNLETHPSRPFYTLRVFFDGSDDMIRSQYMTDFEQRRELISKYIRSGTCTQTTCPHIDAGVDLYVPTNILTQPISGNGGSTIKVAHNIHCAMYFGDIPCGFYMYLRSSIHKTNLRLANSVGIIDAGYRGDVMAVCDVHPNTIVDIVKHTRIVQLCAPNLTFPICPIMVDTIDALGGHTIRGSGGFGSTGV